MIKKNETIQINDREQCLIFNLAAMWWFFSRLCHFKS